MDVPFLSGLSHPSHRRNKKAYTYDRQQGRAQALLTNKLIGTCDRSRGEREESKALVTG